MEQRSIDAEPGLLASVDVRAFLETVRLRWWVIPLVLAASAVFLTVQESNLRTTPEMIYLSKSFEIPDPKKVLAEVKIVPDAIMESPSPEAQLILLGSAEVADEIDRELGRDINVDVPRTNAQPFVFTCRQPEKSDCERAIDAYVAKLGEIRRDALLVGLESLQNVLEGIASSGTDPEIPAKIAAVKALKENLNTTLVEINSVEEAVGPTVSSVSRSTYVFSLAVGALVSLLILLQLTYSDSRIRSERQLVRLTGSINYIGRTSTKANAVRDRRAALRLFRSLGESGASLRFIPLRRPVADDSAVVRLTSMAGLSGRHTLPFSEMNVSDLTEQTTPEVDVLVVQRNRDLRKDLADALEALRVSGRNFGGVLLIG